MIAIKGEDNERINAARYGGTRGYIMELIKSFDSYKLKDGMFTLL